MTVVPYLPTLRWYAAWFGSRCRGMGEKESQEYANRVCRISGKDFARTVLISPTGTVRLSVAVEGGAPRLKRAGAEGTVSISGHGNWPHVHLGAIEAGYGRAPYYQYLMPELREILTDVPLKLKDLNRRLHTWLTGYFQPYKEMRIADAVMRRGEEIGKKLDPDISVIDALMRYGPETNLVLIHYYSETSDYATTCLPLAASAGSPDRESGGQCPSDCAQADTVAGSA